MKNLYLGLKSEILANTTSFKFVSMWNGQTEYFEEGKSYDFAKPAAFIEIVSESEVDSVGNNVQIFDPLDIIIHVIDDFYNADDGTMEVNLRVFDLDKEINKALQLNKISGADYGSGPIGRVGKEMDYQHTNIYHSKTRYRTTWTDNSLALPIGGGTVGPTLLADLSVTQMPIDAPVITVSVGTLNFGNIVAGQSSVLNFTIQASKLLNALTMAVGNSLFTVSLDNVNFATLEMLSPEIDGSIALMTIYVKFSPTATGAISSVLNYGSTGLTGSITLNGTGI